MNKSRDIIKKRLIPEISKNVGKLSMSHRLGGTLASSYNSSDVYSFDRQESGEVIIADPERSYLTTTLYPISSKDSFSVLPGDHISGRFTDNLYASLGDAENYSTIMPTKISGLFKVALLTYTYGQYANVEEPLTGSYRESFRIMPKTLAGILRDVLKKYNEYLPEAITVKPMRLAMAMRSVLIKYEYYKPEELTIAPTVLRVNSSVTLSGSFESYIPFDADNRIIAEVVPVHTEITDKASVSWSKTGSPIVQNSVSKEGDYALYLNGEGSSIKSQESLEYVPSDNESLIIENWLKPDTLTTSLLTRYGGTNVERGLYYDYAQNSNWVGNNVNTNTGQSYVFRGNNTTHFLSNSDTTALNFKVASESPNGQTLEINAKLKNASNSLPLVLLSNQSPTWLLSPTGKSAAVVYFGNSHTNASYAGRVAVMSDNTTNSVDANGILLISGTKYAEDSTLNIAIVTYGNYIRLFVNGRLEAYTILSANLNLSYLGSYVNKSNWSNTPPDMSYSLYALRFTNFALYTSNYTVSSVYSPRAIPKIKSLNANPVYPEGISCGVRYIPNTNAEANDRTIVYASLSDGENVFIAESSSIDPSKWNHIRLSIYKNTIVLYVNGIAYSSEIIPFDIELETVSLGSSTNTNSTQSFSGYIDNFKMYKDETFDLEGVKYLELRPFVNNSNNTTLEDFNPEVTWTSLTTPTIGSQSGTDSILGKMFNFATNPKISASNLEIDTQNFGVRTYVYASESQGGVILKKGGLTISLSQLIVTATVNGTTIVTGSITANKLHKIDLRYNRGFITLLIDDVATTVDPIETTLNTNGVTYFGWDGASSLYNGKLGPLSIFDNNRNRVPAIDMLITDFTTEAYYKNTVFSLTARDNVYLKEDRLFFDNGYSKTLNDVILTGTVINSSVENGLYFEKGSYLKVPSNNNTLFETEDFTLEFSVKTNVTDRRQVILDRYFNGIGSWQVSINDDGNIYFTITNSNSSPYYYFLSTTNQFVNDGRWHKVFIVRQGTDLSIYVDNVLSDKFGLGSIFNFNASRDLFIGHQGYNNNLNYSFEGYLNNIRITKGTIVEEETEELGEEGLFVDEFAIAITDDLFTESLPSTFVAKGSLNSVWNVNGAVLDRNERSPLGNSSDGSLKISKTSTTLSSTVNLGSQWSMSFDMKLPSGVGTGYGIPLMNLGGGTEGSGGFALEHFRWTSNDPQLILRNSYSNIVGLPMPFNTWFKITISYSAGVLTMTTLNGSTTLNTSVNFANNLLLTLGTYSGQWLQSGVFYIDNFRVIKGLEEVVPYPTNVLVDPFDNPKVEGITSTNYTNNVVSLRTFETGISSDTLTANIWETNDTVLSNELSLKSKGSARFLGSSYQTTTGLNFKIEKAKDFCFEFGFYTESLSKQTLVGRGSSGTYSYAIDLTEGLEGIEFKSFGGTLTNTSSVVLNYKFETHRWYEVAVCYTSKVGVYFIINSVIYYPKVGTILVEPYAGNAETVVSLGGFASLGFENYFSGYLDNFKLTVGNSQYSKGFGEDAAYLSTFLTADTLPASNNEQAIVNHGVEKIVYLPTNVGVDTSGTYKGFSMGSTAKIINQNGSVLNFKGKPFTVVTKVLLEPVNATKKYLIKSDRSGDKPVMDIYLNETNQIVVEITQQGELLKTLASKVQVATGKWVTIGIVRTAQSVLRLYLDGIIIATLNGVTEDFSSTTEVSIGDTSGGFGGLMNYFKVYKNKVVTPPAGSNLLHITFDETRRTEDVVTDGDNDYLKYKLNEINLDYGIDGKYTSSGFFNGLTSSLVTPRFKTLDFKTQDFDIEIELFPTDGNNKYQTLFAPLSGNGIKIWMNGSTVPVTNNRICIGESYSNPLFTSVGTIHFDKWTVVRITRDGTLLRMYINGLLDSTLILTSEEFNFDGDGQIVGGDSSGDMEKKFKGYLSSIKVSLGDVVRTINSSKFKVISALDFENNNTDLVIYDYEVNTERLDRFRNNWAIIKYSSTTPDPTLQTITTSNEAVKLNRNGFICQNKLTHVGFSEFTIETKFMLTAANMSNWRRLIDQNGLYAINITADKRVEFNGGSVVLQSDANSVVINKWHHVAVTRDSNKVTRLFFDGIKVGESSRVVNYTENSHYPLCLGMYYSYYSHSSYTNYHFEGYMDNFYMTHGVCKYVDNFVPNIPSDTVRANTSLAYVQGGVFKDTNAAVSWTVSNMSVSTNKLKNKAQAMYSSSTSGFLQSTNNEGFKPGYKDFTIDFIISPLQILAATTLFDNRADALLASGLVVGQPVGNTASFTVNIGPSTGTTDWALSLNTGINSIASGNYYHLRITRNLGKIYLFLDGNLKASADYTGEIPSSGVITLGNRVNKNQGFTGYIEQFRYVDNTSLAGTSFKAFTQALI